METLINNEALKISILASSSRRVVFCFTGVGHAMGSIDVQKEEFYRISELATTIFITDKQRSWGNNIDFDEIVSVLESHIKDKQLYALKNSMGGYLAVVASRYFQFNTVVAFVPQYSVSKRIIPTENRWDKYVDEIKSWKTESLEGCFLNNVHYYVFGDYFSKDRLQLALFPEQDNIHKIIIKNSGWSHKVALKLKEIGVLYDCISSCFDQKSANHIKSLIKASSPETIDFA